MTNRKFHALRLEILAVLGCAPDTVAAMALLPTLDDRVLAPEARLRRHARLYSLWERAKQIQPDDLSDPEFRELGALAAHLEYCLAGVEEARSSDDPIAD